MITMMLIMMITMIMMMIDDNDYDDDDDDDDYDEVDGNDDCDVYDDRFLFRKVNVYRAIQLFIYEDKPKLVRMFVHSMHHLKSLLYANHVCIVQ